MTAFLFGYYDLGLRALSAARLGLQVSGDNIANVNTPGFQKRRMELLPGSPVPVQGGYIDRGVEVARIRRVEDRFLQASLERERGSLGRSHEELRGLQDIEGLFGSVDGEDILSAYARFSEAFADLSTAPDDPSLRAVAVQSAQGLANRISETYSRLQAQRSTENHAVVAAVADIDRLAAELATLNDEIAGQEVGGTISPLRDRRSQVVEQLAELTGGTASDAENGRVQFSLPGGPTLVTASGQVPLTMRRGFRGMRRVLVNGIDVTDKLRSGKIGGLLSLRDDSIRERTADLDNLATDLISRANAITTSMQDLDGNPGGPLFLPDFTSAMNIGSRITVSPDILNDPRLLAISATGEVGDTSGAIALSAIGTTKSSAFDYQSPTDFLATMRSSLGSEIVQADVDTGVSEGIVGSLEARRASTTGVSLDEEAVELIRFQRSYEAAARFMQVLNEVTEIAVNLR